MNAKANVAASFPGYPEVTHPALRIPEDETPGFPEMQCYRIKK